MNNIIWVIFLSILPVFELRAGIPYAILKTGINPFDAFIICVFFNILIIPFIFLFLDYLNKILLKIKIYKKFFEFYLNKKITKFKEKHETLEYFILFLFVAIPFPGTGAYTGVLLSWFFELNRKKSFFVIALGVLVAGVITTLITLGGEGLFNVFS